MDLRILTAVVAVIWRAGCLLVLFYFDVHQVFAQLREWKPNQMDCPTLDTRWLPQIHVPMGERWRSFKTLPEGLEIKNSSIPGIGLGVFTNIFIRRYTWLAPYDGEVVVLSKHSGPYAWRIFRGSIVYHYLDAFDEKTSNWARYVDCSRYKREENVIMQQCYDMPYYLTSKDVYPGQELLIYYGHDYASSLGIDVEGYKKK